MIRKINILLRSADRLLMSSFHIKPHNKKDIEIPDNLMNDDEFRQIIIQRLNDTKKSDAIIEEIRNEDIKTNLITFKRKLRASKTITKNHNRFYQYAIAGCILLFIGLGAFTFYSTQFKNSPQKEKQEIPLLVLSNGEILNLTDTIHHDNIENNNIKNIINYKTTSSAQQNTEETNHTNTLIIPALSTYTIILPDNTEVTLNSGSKLIFPDKFDTDSREVSFEGEGFFKVTKSDIPFIIHLQNHFIKVYGTEFNINTYNDDLIYTTLINGKIGFNTDNQKEILLFPQQTLIYNRITNVSLIDTCSILCATSWMKNDFHYELTPLKVAITDIARWYNLDLVIDDPHIADQLISMNVKRDKNASDFLTILEKILNFQIIKDKTATYHIITNQKQGGVNEDNTLK